MYNNLIELTHGVTRVLGSAGLTNVQRFILAGGDNIVDASAATQQIFIYAAAGNDRIGAGAGNDQLWGYGGANTFVFMNNWGDDIINDWSSGIGNKLDLTALASAGVHAISDLTISIAAGSTIVEYGTSSITVYGHTGLTTSDFLFA